MLAAARSPFAFYILGPAAAALFESAVSLFYPEVGFLSSSTMVCKIAGLIDIAVVVLRICIGDDGSGPNLLA